MVIAVALVTFVATSVALGATTRTVDFKATAPAPAPAPDMSIKAALTALSTANAFFLKIPGIPGESTDPDHTGEIDVTALAWGLQNTAGTTTGATFQDLQIHKRLDRATPLLFRAGALGTNLGTSVLSAEKDGAEVITFLTITLTGTKVKLLSDGADTGNGFAETFNLGYTTLKMTYTYQSPTGATSPVTACWNLLSHVTC